MEMLDITCPGCATLSSELSSTKETFTQNFITLKQKIVSTDLLIRKYKEQSKEEHLELKCKQFEEASALIAKLQKDLKLSECQLKEVLLNVDPVKKQSERYEAEIKVLSEKLNDLETRAQASEKIKQQYEVAIKEASTKEAKQKEELVSLKAELNKEKKLSANLSKNDITNLKENLKTARSHCLKLQKRYNVIRNHFIKFGRALESRKLLNKNQAKVFQKYASQGDGSDSDSHDEEDEDLEVAGAVIETQLMSSTSDVSIQTELVLEANKPNQTDSTSSQTDPYSDVNSELLTDLLERFTHVPKAVSPLPHDPKAVSRLPHVPKAVSRLPHVPKAVSLLPRSPKRRKRSGKRPNYKKSPLKKFPVESKSMDHINVLKEKCCGCCKRIVDLQDQIASMTTSNCVTKTMDEPVAETVHRLEDENPQSENTIVIVLNFENAVTSETVENVSSVNELDHSYCATASTQISPNDVVQSNGCSTPVVNDFTSVNITNVTCSQDMVRRTNCNSETRRIVPFFKRGCIIGRIGDDGGEVVEELLQTTNVKFVWKSRLCTDEIVTSVNVINSSEPNSKFIELPQVLETAATSDIRERCFDSDYDNLSLSDNANDGNICNRKKITKRVVGSNHVGVKAKKVIKRPQVQTLANLVHNVTDELFGSDDDLFQSDNSVDERIYRRKKILERVKVSTPKTRGFERVVERPQNEISSTGLGQDEIDKLFNSDDDSNEDTNSKPVVKNIRQQRKRVNNAKNRNTKRSKVPLQQSGESSTKKCRKRAVSHTGAVKSIDQSLESEIDASLQSSLSVSPNTDIDGLDISKQNNCVRKPEFRSQSEELRPGGMNCRVVNEEMDSSSVEDTQESCDNNLIKNVECGSSKSVIGRNKMNLSPLKIASLPKKRCRSSSRSELAPSDETPPVKTSNLATHESILARRMRFGKILEKSSAKSKTSTEQTTEPVEEYTTPVQKKIRISHCPKSWVTDIMSMSTSKTPTETTFINLSECSNTEKEKTVAEESIRVVENETTSHDAAYIPSSDDAKTPLNDAVETPSCDPVETPSCDSTETVSQPTALEERVTELSLADGQQQIETQEKPKSVVYQPIWRSLLSSNLFATTFESSAASQSASEVIDVIIQLLSSVPTIGDSSLWKAIAKRIDDAFVQPQTDTHHLVIKLADWLTSTADDLVGSAAASVASFTTCERNFEPVLTDVEKRCIALAKHMKCVALGENFEKEVHTYFTSAMFSENAMCAKAALCRFLIGLYRENGSVEIARIICYDVIFHMSSTSGFLLAFIISTWPEMFIGENANDSCLMKAVWYILKNETVRIGFPEQFTHVVQQHVPSDECIEDCDSLVTNLIERMNNDCLYNHEAAKSLELIAKLKQWEWTSTFLISTKLLPIFTPSGLESLNRFDARARNFVKSNYLYLLGCIGKQSPPDDEITVKSILKMVKPFLGNRRVPFIIQEAAAVVSLMLMSYDQSAAEYVLNNWLPYKKLKVSEPVMTFLMKNKLDQHR